MTTYFPKHVVYCKGADLRPGMLVYDRSHIAVNGGLFKLVYTMPAYKMDELQFPARLALTPYGWWPVTKLGETINPEHMYQVLSPDNWSIFNLENID